MAGEAISEQEGLAVLEADNDDVLPLMQAAYTVRRHYFGKKVKLNMIINAKSGLCPEDCGYCSQSIVSTAPVKKYSMLDKETLLAGAREAMSRKAGTYCIVAAGKGPTDKELDQVVEAVKEIRETMPLKICACLGILKEEQAERLADAGVHRYNHNLNTSRANYPSITTTHTYDQRVETVGKVKTYGMSPCSGVIIGMGETNQEIVEMAYALRELDADSIPINFLNAIPGTPLENAGRTPAMKALKVLALFRFICPSKEIRVAGGREVNLRTLQPLSLYAANSLFVGDYLTTAGQEVTTDHQIIEDLGFEIEMCAL
ncbi:biotin synthase BioB [Paenibacillus filicis]|uniref:Biotin synthase n=1 Tax=Paenibacillus gyeongsangnamensis TaxID=3388067 RepID=A0ABT4Q8E0_9BACL|nr:biotin synthase BioB [Paenibacillus filicis]MCZ8513135.1 biotin synthase BioB [Paenibacillus filicis]